MGFALWNVTSTRSEMEASWQETESAHQTVQCRHSSRNEQEIHHRHHPDSWQPCRDKNGVLRGMEIHRAKETSTCWLSFCKQFNQKLILYRQKVGMLRKDAMFRKTNQYLINTAVNMSFRTIFRKTDHLDEFLTARCC